MSKPRLEKAYWVVPIDGEFRIFDPNGNPLYGEIFCRVHDEQGMMPTALFKAIVNVAATEEEMKEYIKNNP